MPATIALAVSVANAMAAAFVTSALEGGAALVLYADTTAAPAAPEDAVPNDALELARFPLPETDAATIDDGVATVAPLDEQLAPVTARVGWARVERAGVGTMLPNVGDADEALVLSSLDVVEGEPIAVAAWSFAVPLVIAEAAA